MVLGIVERCEIVDRNKEIYGYGRQFKEICEKLNVLPFPIATTMQLDRVVKMCDALLVTGGSDINPKYYGEDAIPETKLDKFETDSLDFALIGAFSKAHKPILGICKGIQSINVFFGGTLIQDIKNHMLLGEKTQHPIYLLQIDSFIARYYGKSEVMVNSLHHQVIDKVAPGFEVTARNEEQYVEGIQKGNIVGVQWHPELLMDISLFEKFFEEYVTE